MLNLHGFLTEDEFARIAREWFAVARHPEIGRLFTDIRA